MSTLQSESLLHTATFSGGLWQESVDSFWRNYMLHAHSVCQQRRLPDLYSIQFNGCHHYSSKLLHVNWVSDQPWIQRLCIQAFLGSFRQHTNYLQLIGQFVSGQSTVSGCIHRQLNALWTQLTIWPLAAHLNGAPGKALVTTMFKPYASKNVV